MVQWVSSYGSNAKAELVTLSSWSTFQAQFVSNSFLNISSFKFETNPLRFNLNVFKASYYSFITLCDDIFEVISSIELRIIMIGLFCFFSLFDLEIMDSIILSLE